MNPYAALVVLGVTCLLLVTAFLVGRMRARHQIMAPAVSGHPMFERAYRVQMNTLEQAVMFLPVFLLAVAFGRVGVACILGAVWLLARIAYIITYLREPRSRGPAFGLGMLVFALLLLQAAWGIGGRLILG